MAYDAKAVANYFLDLAERNGLDLEHMKLQKLVYFAHGWNLAVRDKALIQNPIEAWGFGPVIPTLYHEFKAWGRAPIQAKAQEFDPNRSEMRELRIDDYESEDNDFTRSLLDRIWELHRDYTSIQLSNATHAEGTPWAQISSQHQGQIPKRTQIPDELIKQYFKSLMA